MNPFTGATFYVNPDYAKQAATSMQKCVPPFNEAVSIAARV